MKGYYIIPTGGEPIEITGKNARVRAINKAKAIYKELNDNEIVIQQFDDSNKGGYMADLEFLTLSEILS